MARRSHNKKESYKMGKDDVAFVLGHDHDLMKVTLTVITMQRMTGKDYLAMLKQFVKESENESDKLFTDEFSSIVDIH